MDFEIDLVVEVSDFGCDWFLDLPASLIFPDLGFWIVGVVVSDSYRWEGVQNVECEELSTKCTGLTDHAKGLQEEVRGCDR